jgi:alanine-synthesizing transaminase
MAGGSSEFTIDVSTRIRRLPPYLFARLNGLKAEKRRAGADVIDLGMGNPIDASPEFVIEKLSEASKDPRNHRYSVSVGLYNLRREVALKYKRRYGVELDPDTEVVSTIGSKEGFSHLMLALLSAGDTVLVGDPAYPIHMYAVTLAGGSVVSVPLGNDEAFLERIEQVMKFLQPRPKLIIFNYPHNPSAITIEPEFWVRAVALAKKYGRERCGRRVFDHEQALQHGRVARRVLLRQPGNGPRALDDQGVLRLRAFRADPDCQHHGAAAWRRLRAGAMQNL